jgi:hypothetical protein
MPPRRNNQQVIEPPLPNDALDVGEEPLPDMALDAFPGEDPMFADDLYGAEVPTDVYNDVAAEPLPETGMGFDFTKLNVQTREDFDALPVEQQELLKAMKRGVQFTPEGAAQFVLKQQESRMQQQQKMAMMQADPVRQEQTRKLKTEADIAEENRMKSMQKTFDTASYMDDLLEKVKTHPGRQYATGKSSILPKVPGTEPANFQVLLDQLQGQQFMQAYETLKGGGQITEVEGRKATDAMARMNPRQSEESFLQGVSEFQNIIRAAKERASAKIQPAGSPSTPAAESAAPRQRKTVAGTTYEKGADGRWYQVR